MALIVETGSVVTSANSYASLAFADAYFEFDSNALVPWTALSDESKEQYLQFATRVLDQKVQWKGRKTKETSPLRWPRTGVYDRDNIAVDSDEIPDQLKECVCEMAKYLMSGEDPTIGQGAEYIKKVVVDVVEVEYQDGSAQTSLPSILRNLLRGLGTYPSALGNMFARIVKA